MLKQLKFLYPFFFVVIVFIFFFGESSRAKIFHTKENVDSLKFSNHAWYMMKIGNISVGFLTVATDHLKATVPSVYTAQFISRVGFSPLDFILNGSLTADERGNIYFVQNLSTKTENGIFKTATNTWQQLENNPLKLTSNQGADWQNIFPVNIEKSQKEFSQSRKLTPATRFLFFKGAQNQDDSNETFIPFDAMFLNNSYFSVKYDEDGFLKNADFLLEGGGKLSIVRVSKDDFNLLQKKEGETRLDFGWLSSKASLNNELVTLKQTLNECIDSMLALNIKMTKEMPQNSYMSYRKMTNTLQLCSDLKTRLNSKENFTPEQKLSSIGSIVKRMAQENVQELPNSIARSANLSLFYNDTISFLWPRIITTLINNTVDELKNNFELEKGRKTLVGITLNMSQLQSRAVVRAQIKLIQSPINFTIKTASTSKMSNTSIAQIYENGQKAGSEFINGQFFAMHPELNISDICAANNGKVGIDLGDAPDMIINADGIRGVWDARTRIELVRKFAIEASIAKNCTDIVFKVPVRMSSGATKVVDQFKSDMLGVENELLLANNVQKSIWVLPGTYRLVVASLVTGKVLGVQEFTVDNGHRTRVTANIN